TRAAPPTGPRVRATLTATESRFTARPRFRALTICGIMARNAGMAKALQTPSKPAATITTGAVASPSAESTVRTVVITPAEACVDGWSVPAAAPSTTSSSESDTGTVPESARAGARRQSPDGIRRETDSMLCAVGDLVEDIVVWLSGPARPATDTPVRIFHRRGGSAANVAAFAAAIAGTARFVGGVGDDDRGDRLVRGLTADGVDAKVQRAGRTGT